MLYELYIFDREENLLEIITEYEDFNYNRKLNSDSSLSFEVKKNNNIKRYNKVGFFDKDKKFQLFFIDDFTRFKDSDVEKINVYCLADFYNLGNTIIDDKRATNLRDAAIKALENTDYKVGVVENFENRNINFYHINRIKALNEIINTYKCEIDIRIEINSITGKIGNKYIDFKYRLGEDTGIRFTYDTALESVEKSTLEGHFNVLWGWGKALETDTGGYSRKLDFADINNNKKYVEDPESIKKYGRLEGIFEDGSIEDKATLLKATKEKLEKTKDPKMSYKANIKDISNDTTYKYYKVNIGDTIVILDEEIKEIIEARIIEIKESEKDTILTLGNFLPALSDSTVEENLIDINNKLDNSMNALLEDTKYPNKLPPKSNLKAKGLFASIFLEWSFENKNYYTYELYASKIRNFNADSTNKIFEGKASSFLYEVKPNETWYFKVRAKNTHNNTNEFSNEIVAYTNKISDAAQYFEEASIEHAVIGSLDLDKAIVGTLLGHRIDARELSVTDGNGTKTLDIDSFGNVKLNVRELQIASKDVETVEESDKKIKETKTTFNITATGINKKIETMQKETDLKFKEHVTSHEFTEFTQTSNKFQFDIQSSSSKNLVMNGSFKARKNNWATFGNPTSFDINDNYNDGSDCYAQLNLNANNQGISQTVRGLTAGEKYTYSAKVSIDQGVGCGIQIKNGEVYTSEKIFAENGKVVKTLSITFTAKENFVRVYLGRGSFGNNGISRWREVQVRQGSLVLPYVDNGNEVVTSKYTLDNNGLEAKFEDGTYAKMGREGFMYYNQGMSSPYKYINFLAKVARVKNGTWTNITLPVWFKNKNINSNFMVTAWPGAIDSNAFSEKKVDAVRNLFIEIGTWDKTNRILKVRPCLQKIGIATKTYWGWDSSTTTSGNAIGEGAIDVIVMAQM